MIQDLAYRVQQLERRLNNILRVGNVAEVDHERARCRVAIGDLKTAWLKWFTDAASDDSTWWAPKIGEQVMVLSPSGEMAQGAVLPAIYQDKWPAQEASPDVIGRWLPDGTNIQYNSEESTLTINAVGDITLNVQGNLKANVDGDVTVDAGGDLTAKAAGSADIEAETISANGGAGVVTQQHICHFTGNPHGDGSSTVKAGK